MFKATIIGHVGSNPEMRHGAIGQPFLRFDVASNGRTRTPAGEWQDTTTWVRVTVFGQRAETLNQSLARGTRVYADGRLESRPWIDRSDEARAALEFVSRRGPDFDLDDLPVRANVGDEWPANRTPKSTAMNGAREGVRVAHRDNANLEDLPF